MVARLNCVSKLQNHYKHLEYMHIAHKMYSYTNEPPLWYTEKCQVKCQMAGVTTKCIWTKKTAWASTTERSHWCSLIDLAPGHFAWRFFVDDAEVLNIPGDMIEEGQSWSGFWQAGDFDPSTENPWETTNDPNIAPFDTQVSDWNCMY